MNTSDPTDYHEVTLTWVDVSYAGVLIILLAFVSALLKLSLTAQLIVAGVRSVVQLGVVGLVLMPIFNYGVEYLSVVVAYVLLMVILSAWEATQRPKYYFVYMYAYVWTCFFVVMALVSMYTMLVIIRPTPLWDPRQVIPTVGMLLGNCINGVSLGLGSLLTGLKERREQVELHLTFGASRWEATLSMFKDAIRTGLMPTINGMNVIGIISIPGMMTGQILGGSAPEVAAKYQMMIMFLIATSSFGITTLALLIAILVATDSEDRLLSDVILSRTRTKKMDLVTTIFSSVVRMFRANAATREGYEPIVTTSRGDLESAAANSPTFKIISGKDVPATSNIPVIRGAEALQGARLIASDLSKSFASRIDPTSKTQLFKGLSLHAKRGETTVIMGVSGGGKTMVLRQLCGLDCLESGFVTADDKTSQELSMPTWRFNVRYVLQTKTNLPGSPVDLMATICKFRVVRNVPDMKFRKVRERAIKIASAWFVEEAKFYQTWTSLSGGEAQRVLLAIHLATKPRVLLLDEPTSALDPKSRAAVEASLMRCGATIVCVTHDKEQAERVSQWKTRVV